MKAIIEIVRRDSVFDSALSDLRGGGNPDFTLSFESARTLFSEITPARLDLLNALRRVGPCTVYALAKATGRNYSNVHTDVARLTDLTLVARTDDDLIQVPFDAIEIHMPLVLAA
jgi:predicted transcriptional regulator